MAETTKITMKLEGADSVIALLRALPPNVSGKLIKPAMMEAGDILKSAARANAYKQLMAEARGYKRTEGTHLFLTAAARAKTYRKGNTTYVAVGFNYKAGGFHAHLVEFGHPTVKGGTLAKEPTQYKSMKAAINAALRARPGTGLGGMTAAGKRWLTALGWQQGDYEGPIVLHGRRKGKPRILKGAWKKVRGAGVGTIYEGKEFGMFERGQRIREGGRLTGTHTKAYPILQPAFDAMKRPMMIAIENELKKIGPEAERLAKNARVGSGAWQTWGSGKSSAG